MGQQVLKRDIAEIGMDALIKLGPDVERPGLPIYDGLLDQNSSQCCRYGFGQRAQVPSFVLGGLRVGRRRSSADDTPLGDLAALHE